MAKPRWFTLEDEPGLADFWVVYERYFNEVTQELRYRIAQNALLQRVFKDTPPGSVRDVARGLVRKGVEEGDWTGYEEHVRSMAARYAEHGLSFDEWYVLTSAVVGVLTPALVHAYGTEPNRLDAALHAMSRFNDAFLVVLATQYMHAKESERTDSENRLRERAARLQVAIEEERTRIAREIHDELGQQLTVLKLDLAWALRRLEASDVVPAHERLREMNTLVDETIRTVRRIATQLRPTILDDLGLVAALEWQAQDIEKRSGINIELEIIDDDVTLSTSQATAMFRSFQEILTNVMRHAEAHNVQVRFSDNGREVVLEVHDDGRGISEHEIARGSSLGLVGIRERVASFGGTLAIEGAAGHGTRITIRMPTGRDLRRHDAR